MDARRFRIITLGCRTNQYESQGWRDQLLASGWIEAQEGEEASLCLVNTCTVTGQADRSSRSQIRGLARSHPGAQIVVTGCAAEQDAAGIAAIPGVTQVVSNKEKERLLDALYPEQSWPEFRITHFEAHTRAFVKVQDGCNSFCTYCIIPYVRGRSRSRDLPSILEEIQGLVASGYKEVVLTGINIGDFDGAVVPPVRLADLVRAVDAVPGLERVRISSIDPDEVDNDLMDAVLEGKKTCHSLHLVLQSGSNTILKRMNRKYTKPVFLETVERLRSHDPDFTFTTDVIVGFPGETEEDFAETLEVIEKVHFAKVHVFPYSPRARTRAALYSGQVSAAVMDQRKNLLLRAAEKAAFILRERWKGRCLHVLIEDKGEEGRCFGHSAEFLPVWIEGSNHERGQIVAVEAIDNSPAGLIGRAL